MLLVFDIGNTNTVMGIFDGDKLVGHWRLTSRKRTADEVGFMIQGMLSSFGIDKGAIDGAIFGSVVPPLDEMIRGGVRKYIGIGVSPRHGEAQHGAHDKDEEPDPASARTA